MHINIYGVGRSATKSCLVQAIKASALAGKKSWVNYEPYYWLDRRANRPNYYAAKIHENTPLILNSDDIADSHDMFLKDMASIECDVVVSKFIRGLGRMRRINEILVPDLTILVIRDLYSQLSSIFAARWDLLGQGLRHSPDSIRFVSELESGRASRVPELEYLLPKLKNRLDVNALYWYTMNWLAVDNSVIEKTYCVSSDVHPLSGVGQSVYKILGGQPEEAELWAQLAGHEIHDDRYFSSRVGGSWRNNINAFLYLLLNSNRFAIPSGTVGSEIACVSRPVVPVGEGSYSEYGGVGKLSIQKNDIYELMVSRLGEKVRDTFGSL